MQGRSLSFETREKMSKAKMGVTRSAEARHKISEGLKGNKSASKSWVVTSPEGIEFEIKSMRQFCLEHNLNQSKMSQVASGKQKSHKGWKCRKVEGNV